MMNDPVKVLTEEEVMIGFWDLEDPITLLRKDNRVSFLFDFFHGSITLHSVFSSACKGPYVALAAASPW